MGFSVSASTAIIFIAAFVSVGIVYTSAYNGFEQVQGATTAQQEAALDTQNTAIDITNVTHDAGPTPDYVNVTVENTGSQALVVNDTDVLLNGTYQTTFESRTITNDTGSKIVVGSGGTDLWLPGERLTFTIRRTMSQPIHVKIVTGPGVAATEVLP